MIIFACKSRDLHMMRYESCQIIRRPGILTLPSACLLNHCIRNLKTKPFDGRASIHTVSTRSLTMCRLEISPKHKIPYNAKYILSDRSHVLYLPTRKRFQAILHGRYDERQGLNLAFIINTIQKKRVVRSWARRRIGQAVTEALRVRGFDGNGRRLIDPEGNTLKVSRLSGNPIDLTTKSTPEALIGTANVYILPDSIKTSFTEVQRQAGVVADKVLETCGRYPRHSQHNHSWELK